MASEWTPERHDEPIGGEPQPGVQCFACGDCCADRHKVELERLQAENAALRSLLIEESAMRLYFEGQAQNPWSECGTKKALRGLVTREIDASIARVGKVGSSALAGPRTPRGSQRPPSSSVPEGGVNG